MALSFNYCNLTPLKSEMILNVSSLTSCNRQFCQKKSESNIYDVGHRFKVSVTMKYPNIEDMSLNESFPRVRVTG